MRINGAKEKIPPFPHHKTHIYLTKKFFRAKNLMSHVAMEHFYTLKELRRVIRLKTSLPRTLLIDPTTDCNLRCRGCWSNDYEKGENLSFKILDDLMDQAREMGLMTINFSGGEPLMRKDDLLKLIEKHKDLAFGAYTNGTLIDEAFADAIARAGNLLLYISIEGTREETDFRRGEGVYDKVMKAMDILRERGIAFGFSACYHAKNHQTVSSREFLDFMREKGCWFGWLFNYIPVGSDADLSLVCSPEQRADVQRKVSGYCLEKDYMVIDFWNNGHVAFGCVGGGTGFVHINARGDVEPCAFCHYSDSNINEVSLLDALKSDFFTAFRKAQPFSKNPFRSCPVIDVPGKLAEVVQNTNARSTHMKNPETCGDLAQKTSPMAKAWEPVAEELYRRSPRKIRRNFPVYLRYYAFRKKISDQRREKS
ncbi:MAG: radical SAM protein [Clostridia bacterium]